MSRNKKITLFIATALVGLFFGFLVQKCSGDPVTPVENNLKQTIRKQKAQADSTENESRKKDSVRIVYVTKWRTLKPKLDSLPCPEALAEVIILTDSIITVDSSLICSLRAELFIDSLIIRNQDSLILNDSIQIASLSKKLKRQKTATKVVAGVGLVGWIIAAFK